MNHILKAIFGLVIFQGVIGSVRAKCQDPTYSNDEYCDDGNNNAECDYDGGACCNNDKANYDKFCDVCACLDPENQPTTTTAPVEISVCTDGGNECAGNTNGLTACVADACASPCGKPKFQGDGFCDDANNNESCEYDKGDCCEPHTEDDWNSYCSACECIDPEKNPTTTTTKPTTTPEKGDCEDKMPRFCKKNKNKCDMMQVYVECPKTCDMCDDGATCKDKSSAKYCKKNEKKCNKGKVAMKCRKTCNKCDEEMPKPTCKDKAPGFCKKNKGKCDNKPVQKKCKKMCKLCSNV